VQEYCRSIELIKEENYSDSKFFYDDLSIVQ